MAKNDHMARGNEAQIDSSSDEEQKARPDQSVIEEA